MKQRLGLISGGLVIIAALAAGGYLFLFPESDYGPVRAPKDLTGIIVPPVEFPMTGKTFTVPNMDGLTTTLTFVSPTAKRDYPMGKFVSRDGVVQGTLVVLDDFVTAAEQGRRAVPMAVNMGGTGEFYYLAILEGDDMQHATSLPLGDRVKVTSVTRTGSQVSVAYLVHDRGQALAEVPRVQTTAIFDIAAGTVVQAGRNPSTEEVILVKNFTGKYWWITTTYADDTIVRPAKPDTFSLTFDSNRLSLGTDCNTGGATFTVGTGSSTDFIIDEIVSTKMFCESAQEGDYFSMVGGVVSYTESANGELTLQLADAAGEMVFTPAGSVLEFGAEAAASEVMDESAE